MRLSLLLLPACAAHSPLPAPSPTPVQFTELTDGVWLHISHKDVPPWGLVRSNGLVIVDGASAVLIDTAWDDAQTTEILTWASTTLGAPITRAVATHAHDDKMGGMAALRDHGVETFALAASNQLAPERGLHPAEHDLTLTAEQTSDQLAPAVVFYPGGAHTTDNLVVALPERGVLFGGCLLRPGGAKDLGNTADADLPHWAAAIDAVAARFPEATVLVPSHGPPAGRELLTLTATLAAPFAEPAR